MMKKSDAHQATKGIRAAICAGDASALRAALLYPDASPPEASQRSEYVARALRVGLRRPGGAGDLSVLELCYFLGRIDLLKLTLHAEHLAAAEWPEGAGAQRRQWWQDLLLTVQYSTSFSTRMAMKVALKAPGPHAVDFVRALLEYNEQDWSGLGDEGAGAALLTEARMRMHIDERLAAGTTPGAAPGGVPGSSPGATDSPVQVPASAERRLARAL